MNIYATIGIISGIAIAVFVITMYIRGNRLDKKLKDACDREAKIGGDYTDFQYSYTTRGGIEVESVVKLPDAALNAMESGINNQIRRYNAYKPDWKKGTKLIDYAVLVVKPMDYTEPTGPNNNRIACLSVYGGIKSAGTVVGALNSRLGRPYIVVAHQANENWADMWFFQQAVDYESEHVRELYAWIDEFLQCALS